MEEVKMFFANTYENFTFPENAISVNVVIWSICAGLALGVVLYAFAKHRSYEIVKSIVSEGCNSPENAKSAEALGLRVTPGLERRLRDSKPLRKYVFIANEGECRRETTDSNFKRTVRKIFSRGEKSPSYDMTKALLYIPEDKRHTAEVRYEQKGSPVRISVVAVILFGAAAAGVTFCLPTILDLLDSAITAFKNL